AMPPATAALFSSAVPLSRAFAANLGVCGFRLTMAKWPSEVKIAIPFAFGPKTSVVFPSGVVLVFFTFFHVPTRSLVVWAAAMVEAQANARAANRMPVVLIVGTPWKCADDARAQDYSLTPCSARTPKAKS